jgi:hypothetical protein
LMNMAICFLIIVDACKQSSSPPSSCVLRIEEEGEK